MNQICSNSFNLPTNVCASNIMNFHTPCQSLNTVCGTACRLSQCLAQASGGEAAREAAEGWEWVARAVGVASAAVKTQSMVLLQDAQSRQQDSSDVSRRHHLHRVHHIFPTICCCGPCGCTPTSLLEDFSCQKYCQ